MPRKTYTLFCPYCKRWYTTTAHNSKHCHNPDCDKEFRKDINSLRPPQGKAANIRKRAPMRIGFKFCPYCKTWYKAHAPNQKHCQRPDCHEAFLEDALADKKTWYQSNREKITARQRARYKDVYGKSKRKNEMRLCIKCRNWFVPENPKDETERYCKGCRRENRQIFYQPAGVAW